MSEMKELKRFIYSATVTSGSGSQSFYIDAESREEADARAANNESNGMYADDSEITDLDALEYEDETTVDDFGDFPLISREQSLIAQLEAAQKERDEFRLAFQQNEQAKQELFAQKDLLITANLNISRRAEKAEAQLIKAEKGEVLVTVSGFTGCGKSAVAGEIEIALLAIGVPVRWTNGDAEKRMTGADYLTALEMYKPHVRIVERNIAGGKWYE